VGSSTSRLSLPECPHFIGIGLERDSESSLVSEGSVGGSTASAGPTAKSSTVAMVTSGKRARGIVFLLYNIYKWTRMHRHSIHPSADECRARAGARRPRHRKIRYMGDTHHLRSQYASLAPEEER
jgi:hypothetical protein